MFWKKEKNVKCSACGEDLGIPFTSSANPKCEQCKNKEYLEFRTGRLPERYDIDEILDSNEPVSKKALRISCNYGAPRDPDLMLECEKVIYDFAFYFENVTPGNGHIYALQQRGGTESIARAIRAFKALNSKEWIKVLERIRNECEQNGICFPSPIVDSYSGTPEADEEKLELIQDTIAEIESDWPEEDIELLFIDFIQAHREELQIRKKD
jgi:hypothetical protein